MGGVEASEFTGTVQAVRAEMPIFFLKKKAKKHFSPYKLRQSQLNNAENISNQCSQLRNCNANGKKNGGTP